MDDVVELARQLIRLNSENPPGKEAEVVGFVREWFERRGVTTRLQPVLPGRDNLLVRLPGKGNGEPPLVLLAHADTVPAGGGWQVPPFAGEIRGDRLYGRGACDMKGSLAALLVAFDRLFAGGGAPQREVLFCLTVDEEMGTMGGAAALARAGLISPEAMVVALEPTSLRLGVVHKGAIWYRLEVRGRAAHAGRADRGADAIYAMALLLRLIKEKVAELPYRHPLLGPPTVSCGLIRGGQKTNIVSDYCEAEIDFRLVPPMTCEEANALVEAAIAQVGRLVPGTTAGYQHLGQQRPPVEADLNGPTAAYIRRAHREALGEELEYTGFFGYTDAAVIAYMTGNAQCVVYGPGDLEQAHTRDEYIAIRDLHRAVAVYTALLSGGGGEWSG